MRRRWIGVLASLALAGGGTFVLVQYAAGADARALEGQEATEVLVVREPVEAGATVEELAPSVAVELVPAKVRAPQSLATLTELSGQVTAVDLVPGEQVLSTRFVEPGELEEAPGTDLLPGLVEVTVSLTPERAVGGMLRPGDLVTVFASFEPFDLDALDPDAFDPGAFDPDAFDPDEGVSPGEGDGEDIPAASVVAPGKTPNATALILHNTLVSNVQRVEDPTTPPPPDGEDPTGGAGPAAPEDDLLVTLAVEPPEAERLVFTAEFGSVWLGHESTEVTGSGSRVRTRTHIYDLPPDETAP